MDWHTFHLSACILPNAGRLGMLYIPSVIQFLFCVVFTFNAALFLTCAWIGCFRWVAYLSAEDEITWSLCSSWLFLAKSPYCYLLTIHPGCCLCLPTQATLVRFLSIFYLFVMCHHCFLLHMHLFASHLCFFWWAALYYKNY